MGKRNAQARVCRTREKHVLRGIGVRARRSSPSAGRATRPAASGGPPRFVCRWFSSRSLPASPEFCLVPCACVALAHPVAVSSSVVKALLRFVGRAQAHRLALVTRRERHQPSARALPASHCSSFVAECTRWPVRSARSTLSRAGLAWQTGAHGPQSVRAPSAA